MDLADRISGIGYFAFDDDVDVDVDVDILLLPLPFLNEKVELKKTIVFFSCYVYRKVIDNQ